VEAANRRSAGIRAAKDGAEKGSSPDQGGCAKGDERCGQRGGGGWEPQYRHRLIGAINARSRGAAAATSDHLGYGAARAAAPVRTTRRIRLNERAGPSGMR